MINVACVVGTRPNFIKITQLPVEFKRFSQLFNLQIVHTGQHFDNAMSRVFFEQFQLPEPHFLNVNTQNKAQQIGDIVSKLACFFDENKTNAVLVVGDVDSTLAAALAAHKSNLPLFHIEAGLRSFDRTMPEEINREITDKLANGFFVTEQSGYDNLLNENVSENRLFFVGNTMIDTLLAFENEIEKSTIDSALKIEKSEYALLTFHRPSNVDDKGNLRNLIEIIESIARHQPTVLPLHPRTKNKLSEFDLLGDLQMVNNLILTEPLGYFDFQKLIKYAKYVVTDSGGIQEETTFRKIPCLTMRDNTERPVTITMGTNTLVKPDVFVIEEWIEKIYNGTYKKGEIPPLWDGNATQRIVSKLAELFS